MKAEGDQRKFRKCLEACNRFRKKGTAEKREKCSTGKKLICQREKKKEAEERMERYLREVGQREQMRDQKAFGGTGGGRENG